MRPKKPDANAVYAAFRRWVTRQEDWCRLILYNDGSGSVESCMSHETAKEWNTFAEAVEVLRLRASRGAVDGPPA